MSSSAGALCSERQCVERNEARLLPRPRGLSGLLKVRPFISCGAANIQISGRQIRGGHALIVNGIVVLISSETITGYYSERLSVSQ